MAEDTIKRSKSIDMLFWDQAQGQFCILLQQGAATNWANCYTKLEIDQTSSLQSILLG
jgi:hypothetical protein